MFEPVSGGLSGPFPAARGLSAALAAGPPAAAGLRNPEDLDALALGATLYMPALRPDALDVALGNKLPALRTLVLCTEDAVAERDLPLALDNLRHLLPRLESTGPHCFVRPRNPAVLAGILTMPGVERLAGFVLPKVDGVSLPDWVRVLERHERFRLMPTLESREVFALPAMCRLRDALLESPLRSRLLALRIGALDLLGLLCLRRDAKGSIYEGPLGQLIDQLLCIFRPDGLFLTAPGYECLDNSTGLADELQKDVGRGLFGKTALHPDQIALIHRAYQVDAHEWETALALTDPERPAVFRLHGRMCEKAVHTPWAGEILRRTELYGCR